MDVDVVAVPEDARVMGVCCRLVTRDVVGEVVAATTTAQNASLKVDVVAAVAAAAAVIAAITTVPMST